MVGIDHVLLCSFHTGAQKEPIHAVPGQQHDRPAAGKPSMPLRAALFKLYVADELCSIVKAVASFESHSSVIDSFSDNNVG